LTLEKKNSIYKQLGIIVGAAMSIFHIIVLGFAPMEAWRFRILHVTFAVLLIFLMKSFKFKSLGVSIACDAVLVLALFICSTYLFVESPRLINVIGYAPNSIDVAMCLIGVILVLAATWKTNGYIMPLLAVIFMAYAWFGKYLPGIIGHKGYSFARTVATAYSTDGVFGTSVAVSSTYVILFVIFGAVLEGTGGAKLFIDLATAAMGKYRGGPGKVSIVASAGMGMISGSAAANAVTTGAFTIPLMKKSGYSAIFAAAVCAVASTGGQIMPPIMGAGAFIMAENVGRPYLSIAAAAVIPALLYYLSLFLAVDHESVRLKQFGLPKDQLPKVKDVMKEVGHLSISIFVLVYFLVVVQATPIKAGLYGSYAALAVALFRKNTRYGIKKFFDIIADGARSSISVVSACACAGLITGVLTMTGLGNKMATLILTLAAGRLIVALILTMIVCIILGMGLPTTASYIIGSSVTVVSLVNLGLSPLVANMFVFYFACISAITPPVAIAAYAAAGIADCNPSKAGYKAWWLGLAAFIVPYMFVYSPELLLESDSVPYILYCCVTAIVGVKFFSNFITGYFLKKKLNILVRAVLLVGSLCMVLSGVVTDVAGVAMIFLCFLYQKYIQKDANPLQSVAGSPHV